MKITEIAKEVTKKFIEMKGKKCPQCKKGTFQETSIQDDMHGELHCTNCGFFTHSRVEEKA